LPLYGCGTWSFTLREDVGLKLLEKRGINRKEKIA
jgi:hypothetical protein